jgi:hypothetical protein
MKKTAKQIKEPVLEVKTKSGTTYRIFMVNVGDLWQRGKFSFYPSLTASMIVEEESVNGYHVQELNIDDQNTWTWIQARMQEALDNYKPTGKDYL